jgi:hypothetical protein
MGGGGTTFMRITTSMLRDTHARRGRHPYPLFMALPEGVERDMTTICFHSAQNQSGVMLSWSRLELATPSASPDHLYGAAPRIDCS